MQKSFKIKLLSLTCAAILTVTTACAKEKSNNLNLTKNYTQSGHVTTNPQSVGTLTGSYLAGRFAQQNQDWAQAYQYMNRVLKHDQVNNMLLQRTFLLSLGNGQTNEARDLAHKIIKIENEPHELALLFLASDAMGNRQYDASLKFLDGLSGHGLGQYTKPLIGAWNLMAQNKYDEAMQALEPSKDFESIYYFHAGLLSEFSNHNKKANDYYLSAMKFGLSVQETMYIANFFERQNNKKLSNMIYKSIISQEPDSPFVNEAKKRLNSDQRPKALLSSANKGASLGIFSMASLLYERKAYESAMVYGQLVQLIEPDMPFVSIMLGDIMAIYGQHEQAILRYNQVSQKSPLHTLANLRKAEVFEISGNYDAAIQLLKNMAQKDRYDQRDALVYLGDMYRRAERYQDAVDTYNLVLKGRKDSLKTEDWPVVYARGMSYERTENWAQAEADLLRALELQPNNPLVLNYLGYSWADRGLHLDKALKMIHRAVTLRPNDGYILDSYGWALYRTGNFDEAIIWLERSASNLSNDATINNHLGDAYWSAGREQEAKFQWMRALNLAEDPNLLSQIDAKIKNGLEPTSDNNLGAMLISQ